MDIRKLIVVGAGQMGSGIAQTAAAAGLQVMLYDLSPEAANQGYSAIKSNMARDVEKGRRSAEEAAALIGSIAITTEFADAAAGADLAIEAVLERLDVKRDIFGRLDAICPPHAVLASNTSSLSITEIASATNRPDRVIGMHFMNPVPVMPLVEIVRGLATSDETYRTVERLTEAMGKTPVEAGDFPGFVSNRVLMPMINEAVYCVYEGVAKPEAVDAIMKLGMRHPMGPLALADLIGLDTCLAIMEVLHQGFGDSKYRPCPLLRKYVSAGWLGRKSGRGFYSYE